jgi:hypothetical protein
VARCGAGDAEQGTRGRGEAAEQQVGDPGQVQRPVVHRQQEQAGQHGADRQGTGAAGPPGQRRLGLIGDR